MATTPLTHSVQVYNEAFEPKKIYGTGQRDSVQQTVCGGRSHLSQQVPGELIIIEREKENDRWRGAKLREVARGD